MAGNLPFYNLRSPRLWLGVLALAYVLFLQIGLLHCLGDYSCDPDEPRHVIDAAKMVKNDFRPETFAHPGHFQAGLLATAFYLGGIESDDDRINFKIGRMLTTVFAALIIFLVYWLARLLDVKPAMAILACCIYGASNLIVEFSQMFRSDIYLTFLMMLSTIFFAKYALEQRLGWFAAGCSMAGVSMTAKYPGLLAGVAGFFLWAFEWGKTRKFPKTKAWVTPLAVALGVIAGSPYMFFKCSSVRRALRSEATFSHFGHDSLGFLGNVWFYIQTLFQDLGNVAFVFAVGGLLIVLWRCRHLTFDRKALAAAAVVVNCLVFFLAMSRLPLHWSRWIIPLIPYLAIFAAIGVQAVSHHVGRTLAAVFLQRAIMATIIAAVVLPSLIYSTLQVLARERPNTRQEFLRWADANGGIINEIYKEQYCVPNSFSYDAKRKKPSSFQYYQKRQIKYLCVNSDWVDRYQATRPGHQRTLFYERLRDYPLMAHFVPMRARPFYDVVLLWDLSDEPQAYTDPGAGPEIWVYDIQNVLPRDQEF